MLAQKTGFEEASQYIEENANSDEFYVDESHTLSISISTERASTSHFNFPEIQADILEIGFHQTMKKYGIKYLITNNSEPRYKNYAIVFTDMDLEVLNYGKLKRRDMILGKFNALERAQTDIEKDRDARLEKMSIELKEKDYFILEKEIGSYRIYNLYGKE